MDLRDSPAENDFRLALRGWLADVLPTLPPAPSRQDWVGRRAYDTGWQTLLFNAGYAGLAWPQEYGGRGSTPTEHMIFLEESKRAGAPYVGANFVGLLHAGPTLIAEGTAEQRIAHLPEILAGREVWCQGFSEPEAGSDLASLRCRAVRDGDVYRVSGTKLWTSYAGIADVGELLVRTDPDASKHAGVSWLILPMDAPGIDLRPLPTVLGSSEFYEMVLTDVPVPVANRVGAEGEGWRIAMVTLSFERGTAWVDQIVDSQRLVAELATLARTRTRNGSPVWADPGVRRDVAHLGAEFDALWALTKRGVSEAELTGVPGVSASVLKLRYTEARQRLMDCAARLLDRGALAWSDIAGPIAAELSEERLNSLSYTIAAGTSQIQRTIIAERILAMPRGR